MRENNDLDRLYSDMLRKARWELDHLNISVQSCKLCGADSNPRKGQGHPLAEVMILNEEPAITGKGCFSDEEMLAMEKSLSALGLVLDTIYCTSAVKCLGCGNNEENVKRCSEYLLMEIEIVQPKVVVVMGDGALSALVPSALSAKPGEIISFRPGIRILVTESIKEALVNDDVKAGFWNSFRTLRALAKELDFA